MQGMGWLTAEELIWNDKGKLASDSPANYKIPTAHDLPKQWNVKLYDRKNEEQTIYNSKAVGEPPFMLAASVWCALNNAVASLGNYQKNPELTMPATPEAVLKAVMRMEGSSWDLEIKADKDTMDSLIKGIEEKGDLYNDKVMPQDVRHAKDIDPKEVAGKQTDEQPEAIEHPNVAGARGPAHSE